MILRSLQPRFSKHLIGFPHTNFGSLVQALYGIKEGISRGLWPESSPIDSKGKKPSGGQRSGDVGTISSVGMRPPRHYRTVGQISGFYCPPSPHVQYRPPVPSRPMTPTYLYPVSQPVFVVRHRGTSCPIHPAPSSSDHYLCAEAIMPVCSVGYAFESRFLEAHGGWIIESIGT